ncbi:MAG: FKBP-type peptidyl-prolyl cis-trans isomerase [Paludibacteraceae bacterium]|nr:FKBP-type peptidyl-prolyl cis-trans isomerase [Paludibacteraceae bacterium]MBR6041149.1 FKBP-type peptidyl-prolyl cis-trans isomerase [Paludibacteraceae bacterium]
MKKLTIAVASLLALPCIHASGKGPLKTSKDSASYALGVNVGLSLKQQLSTLPGGSVDMDIFTEALNSSIKTNDTSKLAITPSKTPAIINMYMQRAQEEQNAKDKAANDIWLANNAKKAGVKTTASGLQYQVLKEGTGATPGAADKVKALYKGTLTNGTQFDGTTDQPIEFELNRVIRGWTEGLQLMKVGAKYRFFIPPELGYGQHAMPNIPANSILIFDVELVDVGKASAAPRQQQPPQSKYSFKPYQK